MVRGAAWGVFSCHPVANTRLNPAPLSAHPSTCACASFFCRYRPLPEAVYGATSLQQPLLQTRWDSVACTELGETVEGLAPLERLLRCENEAAFGPIAEALWEAGSDADAVTALERLAAEGLAEWEEGVRAGSREGRDSDRDDRSEGRG